MLERALVAKTYKKKWSSLLPMIGRKIYFASSRHGDFRMKMIRWLVRSSAKVVRMECNAVLFFECRWAIHTELQLPARIFRFIIERQHQRSSKFSFPHSGLITMSHRCKGKKRKISSTHEKVLEASQEDSSLRFCRLPYILCAPRKRVEPMINATRYLLYSCKCSLSSLVAYSVPYTLYSVRTRLYH